MNPAPGLKWLAEKPLIKAAKILQKPWSKLTVKHNRNIPCHLNNGFRLQENKFLPSAEDNVSESHLIVSHSIVSNRHFKRREGPGDEVRKRESTHVGSMAAPLSMMQCVHTKDVSKMRSDASKENLANPYTNKEIAKCQVGACSVNRIRNGEIGQ